MMHRLALGFVVLSSIAVAAQGPAQRLPASVLPVTRVVLYKTGVGLFEHVASVTGNQPLAVQFTGDQLDDVLQSLTAVDLGDGRVVGISYDSPTPTDRRLQALRLSLGQRATTLQLLESLRGSRLEVRGASGPPIIGRLLNAERRRSGSAQVPERDELSLVTDRGEVRTVGLTAATSVRIADPELRQEVERYLAIAGSNSERSPRRLVLSTMGTGTRQVFVSYVGQSAVWKSTYRLVFPTTGGQQPFLQGWAIVDNVSGADWANVDLSLVAGAPQTFTQPLSHPFFVTRPAVPLAGGLQVAPQSFAPTLVSGTARLSGVVRDSSGASLPGVTVEIAGPPLFERIRAATTDAGGRYAFDNLPPGTFSVTATLAGFHTARSDGTVLGPSTGASHDFVLRVGNLEETVTVTGSPARPRDERLYPAPSAAWRAPAAPSLRQRADDVEARMQDQAIAASAVVDRAEVFEYHLRDRVTIPRNQSALVPILQTSVKAERVSVWNGSMGLRPRRAIWLTNSSDLTLDAGSLSIYDEGTFAGQGLIDAVKPGERRLVSYASDLGVQVSSVPAPSTRRVMRVRIARGLVTQDQEQRQRHSYVLRNDNHDDRIVVLEHPVKRDWTIVGLTPEDSSASMHRFRVSVPAGQTVTFEVIEALRDEEKFTVTDLHHERVMVIAHGARRTQLEAAMQPVYVKSAELDALELRLQKLDRERQAISDEQERLRANMSVLKGSKAERLLLERYTSLMSEHETRLQSIRQDQGAASEQQARLERELSALVDGLILDLALE